jgi:tripartite-type tricarboxylate transporter receptor subunit TctC
MFRQMLRVAGAVAAIATLQHGTAAAVEDFYRSKQIKFVLPTAPGGAVSAYGFALAEFMSRHIPGSPAIIPEYRPGAGGIMAGGYVYNAAPKDGTVITLLLSGLVTTQLMHPETVKFDSTKYGYIGRVADVPRALIAWHAAGLNTIADARTREVPLGATGQGSSTTIHPALMNALAGTRFKIVVGYRGAGETYLALERGEIATTTVAWDGLVSERGHWLDDGKLRVLVRIGNRQLAGHEKVPRLTDLATNAEDRDVLELATLPTEIGYAIAAPPGIPEDRLNALRRAFDLTMKDGEFLEFAKKRRLATEQPMSGEVLRKLIVDGMRTPRSVIERTIKLVGGL